MGMTTREAAALSGVHTVGRASWQLSGFRGFWSDPENSRIFNNDYFVSMLAKGWMPEEVKGPDGLSVKHQWTRSDVSSFKEMMLNSDLCLAYSAPGSSGEHLDARKHDCCAWMDPELPGVGGLPQEVIGNNGGLLCNERDLAFGLPAKRACCAQRSDPSTTLDCGSPLTGDGMAISDVIDFAKDENVWLAVFQRAWTKAVENGHSSLKPLS